MKKLSLILGCLVGSIIFAFGNEPAKNGDPGQVILENEKLRVVQYSSMPGEGTCGSGMHEHEAHLTIILTSGVVRVTHEGGDAHVFDLEAGTTLWAEAEKHEAINSGDGILKVLLVYLKE
ncbi:MAG: hypothetical protein JXN10_03650 [Clostridia bacterium]|nr:hypothetical protein [Clostridia bacterium]